MTHQELEALIEASVLTYREGKALLEHADAVIMLLNGFTHGRSAAPAPAAPKPAEPAEPAAPKPRPAPKRTAQAKAPKAASDTYKVCRRCDRSLGRTAFARGSDVCRTCARRKAPDLIPDDDRPLTKGAAVGLTMRPGEIATDFKRRALDVMRTHDRQHITVHLSTGATKVWRRSALEAELGAAEATA